MAREEMVKGKIAQGSAPLDDLVERRLVMAVRMVTALLAISVVGLGMYYIQQRYFHPNVSLLDRDIATVEEQVRGRPDDLQLRIALANLYVEKGRYEAAISQAEQVLHVEPDNLGALVAIAQANAKKGQIDLAIGYLDRAIKAGRNSPVARASLQLSLVHQLLGRLYLDQGRAEEAVEQLRQALEIDRVNADSLYLLGRALAAQGKLDEAIQSYLRALRLVPDFAEVHAALYKAYEEKGDLAHARYALGMVRYSAGEYDQALEILRTVAQELPDMAEVHIGLAITYEKKGDRARALEEYRLALAADPSSIAARQGIARLGGHP